MKIPKNRIKFKYSSGKEFVYKITQTPFQGDYYVINNSYYVGKEYNSQAPELIKLEQSNTLLFNKATAIFSLISGITSQVLKKPEINSIQPDIENKEIPVRYFSKQINVTPTVIKEIDEDTYNGLIGEPLFQTTYIGNGQTIDQANKQMPGLRVFLSTGTTPQASPPFNQRNPPSSTTYSGEQGFYNSSSTTFQSDTRSFSSANSNRQNKNEF